MENNPNNQHLIEKYGLKHDEDFYIIHDKPVISLKGLKLLMQNEEYLEALRKQAVSMGYDSEEFIEATKTFIAKKEARLREKMKEMNLKPKEDNGDISG
jgi:hypothetical protein